METLVIHPENAEQSQTIKAILKALKVKVEVVLEPSMVKEDIPVYVTELMKKASIEADKNEMTSHEDFMREIKSRLKH
jgi:hypothetical protein